MKFKSPAQAAYEDRRLAVRNARAVAHNLSMNKGHVPTHQRVTLNNAGLFDHHPAHECYSITVRGAQANDRQSVCWATTSDQNQKTPDERDPYVRNECILRVAFDP